MDEQGRSKGVGFIDCDSKDDAEGGLKCDGMTLDGRSIKVQPSNRK